MVATSLSFRRPASTSATTNSSHSPISPSSSNTHSIPSVSSIAPVSSHSYHSPSPPPSSIKHSDTPSSRPTSRPRSSAASIPSIYIEPPTHHRSQSPRPKVSRAKTLPQKPTQFIMLYERPHSPSTLTSSLAPPSLIPMTASGISVKSSSKSSRKSPVGMKLSMFPSTIPTIVPPNPSSGPTTTPAYTFSSHHHQAYAHSLSAQQQLQLHQKEIIHQATRATGIPQHLLSTGPMSPRLIPLGSPGPVTPLTLEDGPDGFFASSHGFGHQQLSQQLSIVASGQRGGL